MGRRGHHLVDHSSSQVEHHFENIKVTDIRQHTLLEWYPHSASHTGNVNSFVRHRWQQGLQIAKWECKLMPVLTERSLEYECRHEKPIPEIYTKACPPMEPGVEWL